MTFLDFCELDDFNIEYDDDAEDDYLSYFNTKHTTKNLFIIVHANKPPENKSFNFFL